MLQRSTISNAVNTAFESAGELVRIASLSSSSVSGFNFATGEVTGTSETTSVEVIPYKTVKNERGAFITDLLIRSEDLPLSTYSTITWDGVDYSIESIEAYEGVVVLKARHLDA